MGFPRTWGPASQQHQDLWRSEEPHNPLWTADLILMLDLLLVVVPEMGVGAGGWTCRALSVVSCHLASVTFSRCTLGSSCGMECWWYLPSNEAPLGAVCSKSFQRSSSES